MQKKTLLWFRQDLRIADNPALHGAAQDGPVLPVYILDDHHPQALEMGKNSRWWLHHSLLALEKDMGHQIHFYKGNPKEILRRLVEENHIDAVYWNRCYEPWRIRADQDIKQHLKLQGVECRSFNGSLLWEPWEVLKDDGSPYKVFTPFYRKARSTLPLRYLLPPPPHIETVRDVAQPPSSLADLELLQAMGDQDLDPYWNVGEKGARKALDLFLSEGIGAYQEGRNFVAEKNVSRLSPHLHFGEISPQQVWWAVEEEALGNVADHNRECFFKELGWREFSYHLLYHFPQLTHENLQRKFDAFPWIDDGALLTAWQQGKTGYPIVDAGMRELLQTGYMHNRVRMIVGSFLVKNLLLHWHQGQQWFWEHLVDADLASNSASWQWVAGCGADAAPYFRIFNPVTQGEKFDPLGSYTRHFLPELSQVPDQYLFKPWEAPETVLKRAGLTLGQEYPHPIVDLRDSRDRALQAYAELKA